MLVRGDWRTRLVVLVFVGSAFCMWLHNAMTGTEIMGWYFVFLAPGFALFLGWGAAPNWMDSFRARSGTAVVLVGLYWVSASGPREAIRERERHPMREVVKEVRGVSPAVTANDRGVITVAMGSQFGMNCSIGGTSAFASNIPSNMPSNVPPDIPSNIPSNMPSKRSIGHFHRSFHRSFRRICPRDVSIEPFHRTFHRPFHAIGSTSGRQPWLPSIQF